MVQGRAIRREAGRCRFRARVQILGAVQHSGVDSSAAPPCQASRTAPAHTFAFFCRSHASTPGTLGAHRQHLRLLCPPPPSCTALPCPPAHRRRRRITTTTSTRGRQAAERSAGTDARRAIPPRHDRPLAAMPLRWTAEGGGRALTQAAGVSLLYRQRHQVETGRG